MKENSDDAVFVGFDLGGTKMLATVFNRKFEILAREKKKTKASEGLRAGLDRAVSLVRETLAKAGVSAKRVGCIGIGAPGPLDLNKGVLLDLPNMGWKDVPLKKTFQSAFECPVTVLNDVDAGVYGEYRFGVAQGARCVLGVFPGTGIGGGCVYNGEILRGRDNSCMEIGHVQVLPEGPLCGCGQRGCLEAVAARLAISAAAAVAAQRGEAPALFKEAGTDLSDIRSGTLAASIAGGDKAVEAIVRQAARWLGIGIAGVINLLAPDVVVLGGGLVEAMPKLYLEETARAARERVMPSFKKSFQLVAAKLGDDAVVFGAAAWSVNIKEKK